MQEAEERSKAAAAKHESCLQQLSAEHAHTVELDSQIEDQHKVSCVATYHNDDNNKTAFQLIKMTIITIISAIKTIISYAVQLMMS